ncbi:MAG TPA: glycosyltransferase family 39 protein [Terriglobales bacterium]|nr:glycosyltransferase family 39 protein [Terriglobales bacterium]
MAARNSSLQPSRWVRAAGLWLVFFLLLIAAHARMLRLPYFWDEAGYYIPAARDLLGGSLIPHSTPSNAHPPLVMAWLALAWKLLGQSPLVTRIAMLALAAFSLAGFFRLAKAISNEPVAAAATFLVAIYPVFFAQSSLAQVDLAAAGLIFWGLEAYFRKRRTGMAIWFSLAALAKETAILVPLGLCLWEILMLVFPSTRFETAPQRTRRQAKETILLLIVPWIPLAAWYIYHHTHTGFVFGNPEFLRYNLQGNLSPLRIALAFLLRLWQTIGYLNLYLLTLACVVAMKYSAQAISAGSKKIGMGAGDKYRPRIDVWIQFALLTVTLVYLLAMSVLGGAVLARYMLPIVPLIILVCVSTIWRRLRFWKAVLAIVAASFIAALVINPPYGFSPEDNLAYADYIRLHEGAENFIAHQYPHARVLTAWPASDELSHPYLGYVQTPMKVVRIEDFTAEQLMAASDARSNFDVALVFSTKYQPPRSLFDRWRLWQEWKRRFFGYHIDMSPGAAASILGGELVYKDGRQGQWVGVIRVQRIEEAQLRGITNALRPQAPATASATADKN